MTDSPIQLRDKSGRRVFQGTQSPGGGSQPKVLLAQAVLTDAQIKALPTSGGFELVATPGPGKMIWAQNAVFYCDTTEGAYDAASTGSELGVGIQFPGDVLDFLQEGAAGDVNSLLHYGGLALAACGPLSTTTGDTVVYPLVYGGSDWENLPLKLYSSNAGESGPADYTGGDPANKLVVAVTYSIIDTILPA